MEIDKHIPEIQKSVLGNYVTEVIAPTGSGKSIRVPITLCNMLGKNKLRIFVALPTVFSVKSIFNYVLASFITIFW